MGKFIYMKVLGLLLVIVGFSYSLTSFSNFYGYLFGDITVANGNVIIMGLGLLFPLYTFIFGIYFYFYSDKFFANINPFILSTAISMFIVGIVRIFVSNGIMEFIHYTFVIPMIILSVLLVYGCVRYRY